MELEYIIKIIVPYICHSLEFIGIFIICVGAIKTFYEYVKTIKNPNKNKIKMDFAESVALALDYKLAGEIIKTVTIKSMEELYVLGAVVILRVVLTFVVQWEISQDKNKNQNNKQS